MGIGAAILGAAGIAGVGSVIASGTASNAAQNSADTAANTQLQMFNQTKQTLSPFVSTGTNAMSQLASIFGYGQGGTGTPDAAAATSQLTQFPGYQFGLDQGVQALDRSAASRGLLLSGAQLQDTQKFGQNYAMQQAWQPYVSGLQWASNLGENAAAGTGQLGATAAAGAASSQLQGGLAAGSAASAGDASVANILSSGLNSYALQNNNPYAGTGYVNPTVTNNFAAGQDPSQLGLI